MYYHVQQNRVKNLTYSNINHYKLIYIFKPVVLLRIKVVLYLTRLFPPCIIRIDPDNSS